MSVSHKKGVLHQMQVLRHNLVNVSKTVFFLLSIGVPLKEHQIKTLSLKVHE